jgi:hypothetical protein
VVHKNGEKEFYSSSLAKGKFRELLKEVPQEFKKEFNSYISIFDKVI